MDRRRGTLPVGNNFPNYVPAPNFVQQQQSFGSTDSAESNDSFQTQLPLSYHLPQDHPYNNQYAVDPNSFAQYSTQTRSTGSNGTTLDPTSSVYIPQGNTPVLPSAGISAQGWGAPYIVGQNGQMVPSYQQQGQQMAGMQYQTGKQYQQQVPMQAGGPVGGMNSQAQGQYGNIMGPYGHFGVAGVAPNNQNEYGANGPTQFVPFATPEMAYATAVPAQNLGMHYAPAVVNQQPVNPIYNGRGNNMYQNPSIGAPCFQSHYPNGVGSSFQSNSSAMYSGQVPGSSSFDPAYTNQTMNTSVKSILNKHLSRPGSGHSNVSGMREQKKPFNSFTGKELNSSFRNQADRSNASQRFSNSNTPTHGGAVQAPQGIRELSPEKQISKSNTPESSRNHKNKNKVVEDTSGVPTPISKPHPSDVEFTSEQRLIETHTPHLRSRRNQSVADSDTIRKQSVSSWAADVQTSSDPGMTNDEEMKRRGSPVKSMSNAMNLMTITERDPFMDSAVQGDPFSCMTTPGPFNGNFATNGPFSDQLLAFTASGRRNPTLAEAVNPHNVPFAEYSRFAKSDNWGVIKIKNIPYGVNRAEVLAFLGRNARIISESEYEPIHIVMERVTSKTLDCFVEFLNLGEAVSAVNRFETNRMGGRGGRLGQRHVEVELSTQGALLKELFPKAKNVQWESARPQVIEHDENDPYNSGFQGFVTKEELVMMIKHVETPQRSPFSKDCPQRPFECLISTLVKYPWYMVEYITVEDRNMLHEATKTLLGLLVERVNSNDDQNVNMNKMLLKRVWRAALRCPGFSPSMKDDIVYIAGLDDRTAIEYGLAPHASFWYKLWTIGPKPDVPVDVILWYIGKIRQACATRNQLSLAEQAEKGEDQQEVKLFGDLDKYINFGPGLNDMTLAKVAKIEWTAIENALRRAFTPALPAPR